MYTRFLTALKLQRTVHKCDARIFFAIATTFGAISDRSVPKVAFVSCTNLSLSFVSESVESPSFRYVDIYKNTLVYYEIRQIIYD